MFIRLATGELINAYLKPRSDYKQNMLRPATSKLYYRQLRNVLDFLQLLAYLQLIATSLNQRWSELALIRHTGSKVIIKVLYYACH